MQLYMTSMNVISPLFKVISFQVNRKCFGGFQG